MFRTIFFRLAVTTLTIIFISFLVAGILLYGFLGEYAVSEKEKTLRHYADRIAQMAAYLAVNNNRIVQEVFSINVEGYAANSNSIIFIVDNSGKIQFVSSSSLKYLEGNYIESHLANKLAQGQEIRVLGNVRNLLDKPFLTIGYPIRCNNGIIGGVIMNTPVPELQRLRSDVYILFLKAIGISALIAAISIYFMSRRISNPMREMRRIARKIANGEFESRVGITSNDEVGELAKTFNYMADKLEDIENLRRSFIANVSHELRTPMTSIIGFAEGILDGTIPVEKHNHYILIIKEEGIRLTKLVNDLLDLAKMESGGVPLNIKRFNLSELIRRGFIKFETQINSKGQAVELCLFKEDHYVMADPDAIERVIANLLDNAIKFTPQGGVISIKTFEKDENKVFVSIEDTGPGIDKEDLPYIWERFFKTDKSRSKDKIGTGLGLAIVKNIIHKHNQNIWVESKPDKGSKFTFTLEGSEID